MPADLPLRCRCATMRGRAFDVAPPRGLRLICHCVDCQSFAYYLGEPGPSEPNAILDAWGGTEVVQLPPGRVELSAGADQLACVRLSEGGLMRWYAGCCRTPIANTLANAGIPFVGLVQAFVDPELDADAREALLGPVRARVNGPRGPAGPDSPAFDRLPLRVMARSIFNLALAWRRRLHWPTPFYDHTGAPLATPTILSAAERAALRERVAGDSA